MAEILEANSIDVANAQELKMTESMRARLVLSSAKILTLAEGLRSIAAQPDPIGKLIQQTELAEGLVLQQKTVPIGVLLVIFESRPDCVPQIAGLTVRSGNGLILKGGKECPLTIRLLHRLMTTAIEEASGGRVPRSVIGLVETRAEVSELLKLDGVIDLIIPRGSGELVRYIQANTSIPVMGHAEGICHVYVDEAAALLKALKLVLDAKTDYPAACNAMETLLLHEKFCEDGRALELLDALRKANVQLFGGPKASQMFSLPPVKSFRTEYSELACSVEVVPSCSAAIAHIHQYGSGHTEAIVTENKDTAEFFLRQVDAACVFHNVSTRFADGYRFGLGAEVGISTGRIHARGPVGVTGLCTTKWVLRSQDCDVASEFSRGQKKFLHRAL